MLKIKETGIYTTRTGRKVEIENFGPDENKAEGYFLDNRALGAWKSSDGTFSFYNRLVADYDLVAFDGKTDE